MKTLIKNGKIIKKENQLIEAALWLENGVIHAIGESFDEADFEQVFDANGQLIRQAWWMCMFTLENQALRIKKRLKRVVKLLLAVVLLRFAQCPI